MNVEKEKIDSLLEQNIAEQLDHVDWDRLNSAISSRLDQTHQRETTVSKFPIVFKVAAGLATVAAVVLIAVTIGTDKPAGAKLESGRFAVVKLIETKGSASIEIKHDVGKSQVMVDIWPSHSRVAKCNVKIIDLNGDLKKDDDRPAWIIISRPEPVYADNGTSKDIMSMICLF